VEITNVISKQSQGKIISSSINLERIFKKGDFLVRPLIVDKRKKQQESEKKFKSTLRDGNLKQDSKW
jgi:hypothetical protein